MLLKGFQTKHVSDLKKYLSDLSGFGKFPEYGDVLGKTRKCDNLVAPTYHEIITGERKCVCKTVTVVKPVSSGFTTSLMDNRASCACGFHNGK